MLRNASVKMQFECRVYYAKNKNTQSARKCHAESVEKYTYPLCEHLSLLGVLGMCSELRWGVSCEIADIHTMSVVPRFGTSWNVFVVFDEFARFLFFGAYYVCFDDV